MLTRRTTEVTEDEWQSQVVAHQQVAKLVNDRNMAVQCKEEKKKDLYKEMQKPNIDAIQRLENVLTSEKGVVKQLEYISKGLIEPPKAPKLRIEGPDSSSDGLNGESSDENDDEDEYKPINHMYFKSEDGKTGISMDGYALNDLPQHLIYRALDNTVQAHKLFENDSFKNALVAEERKRKEAEEANYQ